MERRTAARGVSPPEKRTSVRKRTLAIKTALSHSVSFVNELSSVKIGSSENTFAGARLDSVTNEAKIEAVFARACSMACRSLSRKKDATAATCLSSLVWETM